MAREELDLATRHGRADSELARSNSEILLQDLGRDHAGAVAACPCEEFQRAIALAQP